MSQGDKRYPGFGTGSTACATTSQVPGAGSQQNSLSLHGKLLSPTLGIAYGKNSKKEDGRGKGDKLVQHGKNVGRISYSAAVRAPSLTRVTRPKTSENNFKEDAHPNAILKMLHEKNYQIDFHGYSPCEALEVLRDIIITLRHNMKGKSEQKFTIITGKGIHSPGGIPIVKEAVLDYLKKNDIKHREQRNNSSRIDIIVEKK